MLKVLARLARVGANASPAVKARLDAVLAPTAWWYVQRASARARGAPAGVDGAPAYSAFTLSRSAFFEVPRIESLELRESEG